MPEQVAAGPLGVKDVLEDPPQAPGPSRPTSKNNPGEQPSISPLYEGVRPNIPNKAGLLSWILPPFSRNKWPVGPCGDTFYAPGFCYFRAPDLPDVSSPYRNGQGFDSARSAIDGSAIRSDDMSTGKPVQPLATQWLREAIFPAPTQVNPQTSLAPFRFAASCQGYCRSPCSINMVLNTKVDNRAGGDNP